MQTITNVSEKDNRERNYRRLNFSYGPKETIHVFLWLQCFAPLKKVHSCLFRSYVIPFYINQLHLLKKIQEGEIHVLNAKMHNAKMSSRKMHDAQCGHEYETNLFVICMEKYISFSLVPKYQPYVSLKYARIDQACGINLGGE